MWASWVAISSQLFYDSDWLPDLPLERLDILRRTMLPHRPDGAARRLLRRRPNRESGWSRRSETAPGTDRTDSQQARPAGAPRREVVALFNWGGKAAEFDVPMAKIGLAPDVKYVGFDFGVTRSYCRFTAS